MNYETMFCHDPHCRMFNEPQSVAYLPTTYDHPSEWVDDPECSACNGELHDKAWEWETLQQRLASALDYADIDEGGVMGAASLTLAKDITRALEAFDRTRAWNDKRLDDLRRNA